MLTHLLLTRLEDDQHLWSTQSTHAHGPHVVFFLFKLLKGHDAKTERKIRFLQEATYKQTYVCTRAVKNDSNWEGERKEIERLKGVIWALKDLEGDRKRIVKCKKERGRMRERYVGRG